MRGDGPAPAARPSASPARTRASTRSIAADAKVELVANGFGLNESTTWVHDGKGSGFLLVGGLLDNVLYKITPDNTVSRVAWRKRVTPGRISRTSARRREPADRTCCSSAFVLGVDPEGRIVWCADDDLRSCDWRRMAHAHRSVGEAGEGKRSSGPNDISIKSDGAIYLTDNDFGLRGAGKSPRKELQNGIWRIKDGKTTRVLSDTQLGGIPNGITFSPDEKYLYLTAGSKMMRYDVKAQWDARRLEALHRRRRHRRRDARRHEREHLLHRRARRARHHSSHTVTRKASCSARSIRRP